MDLSSYFIPFVIEDSPVSHHFFYKLVPRIASGAGGVRSNCCSDASSCRDASNDMQKMDSPMRKWHPTLRSTIILMDLR
ncbi:MAG TPA: hypothetical protein VK495_09110, partial [Steroidobacteraceae bacterium]|nr:hypothetical protein [Steroidobacteraceae bacterium]